MPETLRIGNAEILVARDADFRFAPAAFLPKVPREAWAHFLGDTSPDVIEESKVNTYVIRSQGKTILVDTGVGQWGLWRFGDGDLLNSLKAIDVAPEDVDFVLPTHLHADHVGWNTRPTENGPVPTFTNARYLFQKADWDFFTTDTPESWLNTAQGAGPAMMRAAVRPLENTGLMDIIGPERVVTDEVTLLHNPGHTPGSVSVLVQSGGEAALLIGDAAHHSAQITETSWSPMADIDGDLSARSRKALVEQAVRMNAYVAGGHFAASDPSFGRIIVMDGKNYWRGVGR
jgi:glyoxylase-like metal-dependent hydrolase (beta-lactamase superfamily II)